MGLTGVRRVSTAFDASIFLRNFGAVLWMTGR